MIIKKIFSFFVVFTPWCVKRFILNKVYHFKIHKSAHIGLSYIFPEYLEMGEGATIGHFNVAINLQKVLMGKDTAISQGNWITGFPANGKGFYESFHNRKPWLIMEDGSAITKKHIVDCTDLVTIGEYTSIGGYGTQILSHSTSIELNEQSCAPITIGHHCFVGTRSIILPGAELPNQSVLGAGAMLKKKFTDSFSLYGGVPAKLVTKMDENYAFFHRTTRAKGVISFWGK